MTGVRRAIFIDALGTLLWLAPPWERIDPEAVRGLEPARVQAGFIAEMSYYREHADEGADPESLADLRQRCAAVLSEQLGREIRVETMLSALHFSAFDDARPALRQLRGLELPLICVSNWDCSLPGVLERLQLASYLDGVVTSAGAAARKPSPEIFAPALELARCEPSQALHIGDTADDVEAARAAGIEVLRIDRSGGGDISSLSEIRQHLGR
jgi:putative hydrolase of the HAD superfamily